MDELRFVRREEAALIVATDSGTEFRLVVDDTVLGELRHIGRRERDGVKIRPREIQSLIRSGKNRAQVAKITGLDEVDIERYEEPVLAERRYILERAHAVAVQADAHDEDDQNFGSVIGARLVSLGAEAPEWTAWKEDEGGWMVGLEFISHDTAHRAVWSFEHRKGALAPITPDATNLSKQGEVGDRLIPKLRAVDDGDRRGRFDSGAFDREQIADGIAVGVTGEQPAVDAAEPAASSPETQAGPASTTAPRTAEQRQEDDADSDAEYERRREIDQRAVKTTAQPGADLSQTADLLDALRKRRGERERSSQAAAPAAPESTASETSPNVDDSAPTAPHPTLPAAPPAAPQTPDPLPPADRNAPVDDTETAPRPRSIWAAGGVSREAGAPKKRGIPSFLREAGDEVGDDATDAPRPDADPAPKPGPKPAPKPEARKGRASIPSWDDILFGTRSDEDPSGR